MKNLLISIILLISIHGYSQSTDNVKAFALFGFSAGYYPKLHSPSASLTFGGRINNFYVSGSEIIPITTNSLAPKMFQSVLGYNIGSFQPFISYNYQTIGREAESNYKGTPDEFTDGWKPGYGLAFYFKSFPVSITVQRQGIFNSISIGCYKHF